ncbi:unnamed protein product [Oncorhynchus mykiss]|uniref:Reverse transcriptase domain-containing protein n=1 Tax=Oncorhynchus mykiss TaxID=8022 RepID=A0A060VYQ8_ONCMY|nr:unnamed protein product [Oncorhynchus mykiss]
MWRKSKFGFSVKSAQVSHPQEVRRVLGELERCISEMVGQGNIDLQANLTELRRDLGSFFQVKAKGALVRARFSVLKEMDAPSSSFFGLERQSGEAKGRHCLRLSDGRVTSVVGEMRERTVEFYTELYRAEVCDPMSSGRAPGVDGLPVEFYKKFWGIIGQDFFCVLCEYVVVGELLIRTCVNLRTVGLWHYSVRTTRYLPRSSNRLKSHLDSIVHKDQTYCVSGRSITDNLFLIRDMLDLLRGFNVNFGLVSLDREKAFDRVDYEYLFNVMFGKSFFFNLCEAIVCWGIMYVQGGREGISRPVWVKRGIRQGCPLSGQLYPLAIETFFGLLRRRLQGVCWTGMEVVTGIAVSPYANVSVMVRICRH